MKKNNYLFYSEYLKGKSLIGKKNIMESAKKLKKLVIENK